MSVSEDLQRRIRMIYNKHMAAKLNNSDFSVIASNCNGAFILHDLGMQFNSPFVNLWMKPDDFVKMLKNLKYYMRCNLVFTEELGISYPVGCLDDIRLYFRHYHSPEEALEKWNTRVQRINYDNLFILFSDRDGCTYQNLAEYDALPFQNKVVFTHVPYPELKSAFYLKGWENEPSVGHCYCFRGKFTIKKHYDAFDYVAWFNHEIN